MRGDVYPKVYEIEDQAGERVKRTFYASKLQKVSMPETFEVETILKRRKRGGVREMFVRWLGYPQSMNSWVNEKYFV